MLERYHTTFRRAGAHLEPAAKARLAAIGERLATLGTAFSQNVLADERDYMLVLESEADLAGLPDFVRAAAGKAAEARGLPGKHVITLARSSVEPFLQYSVAARPAREGVPRLDRARRQGRRRPTTRRSSPRWWRCAPSAPGCSAIRAIADYRLDDQMAKTPDAVRDLLGEVWPRARKRALADRDAMQALVAGRGRQFQDRALGLALLRREAAQAPARCR